MWHLCRGVVLRLRVMFGVIERQRRQEGLNDLLLLPVLYILTIHARTVQQVPLSYLLPIALIIVFLGRWCSQHSL